MNLISIDAEKIKPPSLGETYLTKGSFDYYHYSCDGFDDIGWGCGYRTLQTICSWINNNVDNLKAEKVIPNIPSIQQALIDVGDKTCQFKNSKDWIGAFEVCLVIDHLYDVPCKIIHINSGLDIKNHLDTLRKHFITNSCLIMMGGDADCSSKGIAGIHIDQNDVYLLVIDPHYKGKPKSTQQLQNRNYIQWQPIDFLLNESFYNLCLPQTS